MNPQDHISESDWNAECIRLFRNEPSTIVFRDPVRVYAFLRYKIGVEVIGGPLTGCRWEQSIFPVSSVKSEVLRDAAGIGPGVQHGGPLARALLGKTAKVILRPYGSQSLKVRTWLPRDKGSGQEPGQEQELGR